MDEISILYPNPPPYYKAFTAENVAKIELKKLGESVEQLREDEEVSSSSLKYLVPPEIPQQQLYHSFGNIWQFKDKFMNLSDAGIQQLYPDPVKTNDEEEDIFTMERIQELKKLTKSLLLNFLELVGLVVKNPYYLNEKVEQTRIILINLHHLLNSYRLHQSREDLILKIEDKISTTEKEVQDINDTVKSIEDKFSQLLTRIDSIKDVTVTQPSVDEEKIHENDKMEALIQEILEE